MLVSDGDELPISEDDIFVEGSGDLLTYPDILIECSVDKDFILNSSQISSGIVSICSNSTRLSN
ncbi:unnamed protein product [Schistosoma margrebowiei]|uniref:Uncharacterized protein n=1 Tax=Schistosoma margrebowiei TaxID=48269 RepID=A0A3P7Y2V8_9TREM|nr:unnamed protein product [Schistosoma margrebowiei]